MLPDRLSNPGPLTYESGALPIALRGPLIQEGQLSVLAKVCPAGIWCENDVVLTSMRRDYVASTLIRRHFDTKCPLGVHEELVNRLGVRLTDRGRKITTHTHTHQVKVKKGKGFP